MTNRLFIWLSSYFREREIGEKLSKCPNLPGCPKLPRLTVIMIIMMNQKNLKSKKALIYEVGIGGRGGWLYTTFTFMFIFQNFQNYEKILISSHISLSDCSCIVEFDVTEARKLALHWYEALNWSGHGKLSQPHPRDIASFVRNEFVPRMCNSIDFLRTKSRKYNGSRFPRHIVSLAMPGNRRKCENLQLAFSPDRLWR